MTRRAAAVLIISDGSALVTDLEARLSATADTIVATGAPRPATCDSENQ